MKKNLRVHIIDSSRLFREGLKRLFASSPFSVVGESADIAEFADNIKTSNDIETAISSLDFLLVQWTVSNPSLATRIAMIVQSNPRLKVVVLADTVDPDSLADAFQNGAQGFLLKDISTDALLQSLLLVETGEKVLPSELAGLLVNFGQDPHPSPTHKSSFGDGLSKRERQILDGLILGQSNKAIARTLDVAEGTVKVHLKSLLRKIKARNRTQAAIWGLNHSGAHRAGNSFSDTKRHLPRHLE